MILQLPENHVIPISQRFQTIRFLFNALRGLFSYSSSQESFSRLLYLKELSTVIECILHVRISSKKKSQSLIINCLRESFLSLKSSTDLRKSIDSASLSLLTMLRLSEPGKTVNYAVPIELWNTSYLVYNTPISWVNQIPTYLQKV